MGINFSLFRSIQIGVLFAMIYYVSIFNNGDSLKAETKKVKLSIVKQKKELKAIVKEGRELKEVSALFANISLEAGAKILNTIKSYSEGNSFSIFLSDQVKKIDLYLLSLGRVVVSKDEKWEIQEIQLSLEGGYHQLMQFIANIQNEEKLVIIEKITLNLTSASNVNSSIRLQAQLSVKLYQFIKEKKEDIQ